MNSSHSSPQRVIIGYESPPMKAGIASEYGRHPQKTANRRGETRDPHDSAVPSSYGDGSATDANFQMRYTVADENAVLRGDEDDDGFRGSDFVAASGINGGSSSNAVMMNGYGDVPAHRLEPQPESTVIPAHSNGGTELPNGYPPHQQHANSINGTAKRQAECAAPAADFVHRSLQDVRETAAPPGHHYQLIGSPSSSGPNAAKGSTRSTELVYAQAPALQTYVVVAGSQESGAALSAQQPQPDQQGELTDARGSPSHHDRLIRDAARKRQRREVESNVEAEQRRAKNLAAKRRRLERETNMERVRRRARDAETKRVRRQRETPQQRAARLSRDSERMRRTRRLKKLLGPAASLTDHELMRRNGLTLDDLDVDPPKRRCIRYGRQDAVGQQATGGADTPSTSSTVHRESNLSPRKRQTPRPIVYGEQSGAPPRQIVHHQFVDTTLPTTYVNIMTQSQGTASASPQPVAHHASGRLRRPVHPQPSVQVQVVQQTPFIDDSAECAAGQDPSSSMAIISSSVAESTGVVTLHLTLPDEPHREHVLHLPRSSLPQRIVVQRQPAPPSQQTVSTYRPPPPVVYPQQRAIAPPEYHQRRTSMRQSTPPPLPPLPPLPPPPPHFRQLPQTMLSTPKLVRRPTTSRQIRAATASATASGSTSSVNQTPSTSSTAFNSPGETAKYALIADSRRHGDMGPSTSRANDATARRRLANAERSRRRRAMETAQQRAERNRKTAERMRLRRAKLAEERLNMGLMTVPIQREILPLSEDRFEEIFKSVLTHQHESDRRYSKRKLVMSSVRRDIGNEQCSALLVGGEGGEDEDALLVGEMLVNEEEEVIEDGEERDFDLSQDSSSQGNFADELEQIMANEHARPSISDSLVGEESQSPILRRGKSYNDQVPGASVSQPPLLAPLRTMDNEPLITEDSLEGSITL